MEEWLDVWGLLRDDDERLDGLRMRVEGVRKGCVEGGGQDWDGCWKGGGGGRAVRGGGGEKTR